MTVTDSTAGPVLPGQWYNIPVITTGGGFTRTATISLLIGGTRTYLPVIRK
ncbi:MAG: hypothetical protein HC875_29895 [Anaerolineales bacterium]|nr:hypothetical protein [Anaerolineales bacterium]